MADEEVMFVKKVEWLNGLPTHIAPRLDSILVNLWTFQSPAATELIRNSPRYYASWGFSGGWDNRYRWMCDELKRLKNWDMQYPPVWAWHKTFGKCSCPGKLVAELLLSELQIEQGVYRIKLSVPDDFVVLSAYGMWNDALDHFTDHGSIPADPFHKMFSTEEINKDVDTQACLPFIERDWVKRVEKITIELTP